MTTDDHMSSLVLGERTRWDQTTFAPTEADPNQTGNCMQAAVATLLGLQMEDVPHFAAQGDWWTSYVGFLNGRRLGIISSFEPMPGVLSLLSGRSPRGPYGHMVVACGSDIVHDPHPSRDGILFGEPWGEECEGEVYEFLVAFDPMEAAS